MTCDIRSNCFTSDSPISSGLKAANVVHGSSCVLPHLGTTVEDGTVSAGADNILTQRALTALALTPQSVESDLVLSQFLHFLKHNFLLLPVLPAMVAQRPVLDHNLAGQAFD